MSPPEDNASQADLSMAVSVLSSGVFGLVRSDKGDGLPVDFATFFKALAASPAGLSSRLFLWLWDAEDMSDSLMPRRNSLDPAAPLGLD